MVSPQEPWQLLGAVSPTALADTRVQLHWAAQAVAAAGAALHEPRPDTGQSNLGWLAGPELLAGRPVLEPPLRLALRLTEPALVLLDAAAATELDRVAIAGTTLDELLAWAGAALAEASPSPHSHRLVRAGYELPAHAVADGGRFRPDPAAAAELGRWLACADAALGRAAAANAGASEVRCWPHHFDLATLITVAGGSGEDARSIGAGLSPGDASYAEPYWYVTPWPYPPAGSALPALPSGHWHREVWTGAVLTGSETVGAGGADRQAALVAGFLDAAIAACRASLAA